MGLLVGWDLLEREGLVEQRNHPQARVVVVLFGVELVLYLREIKC